MTSAIVDGFFPKVALDALAVYVNAKSPLTEISMQDLARLQGKVRSVRTYSVAENLETVPQRAGKYGL